MIVFYIVIGFLIALAIAVWHYRQLLKSKEKVSYLLTFFRFLSLFGVLLLLINPEITTNQIQIVKPKLTVLVDDSKSIADTSVHVKIREQIELLRTDNTLNAKFNLEYLKFGASISNLDSLTFADAYTNIYEPLKLLNNQNREELTPLVVFSDGNQTFGRPYKYFSSKQPVYPIIVGDTIQYEDVSIEQLNVNKYTFLDNNFPIELILNYEGPNRHVLEFSIEKNGQKYYKEQISLSSDRRSKILSLYLPAQEVGMHYYSAKIEAISNEKNRINNTAEFAVEVIDEQAKVLILTSYLHPDLGAFKKSIEVNKQRTVEIKMIDEEFQISDYEAIMLYQPDQRFQNTFTEIDFQKCNHLIVTGSNTDWNFLNSLALGFQKNTINQTENYGSYSNPGFTLFDIPELDFFNYPPLLAKFGNLSINASAVTLLYQKIGTVSTDVPQLFMFESDEMRTAVLIGENSWKWRAQHQLTHGNTETYDAFIGKLMQYLSISNSKKRLEVDVKAISTTNESLRFNASYVDKSFGFNPNAKLWLSLTHEETKETTRLPFRTDGKGFAIDLEGRSEGIYTYLVSVENSEETASGNFKIVNFDVEQQFFNANTKDLKALAFESGGKSYHLSEVQSLIDDLGGDDRYKSVRKIQNKKHSLINWKWLFAVIVISLSIEWFIRKYRGLI